ncbi:MAG: ATP-binding protein [Myxococcota bacterium]
MKRVYLWLWGITTALLTAGLLVQEGLWILDSYNDDAAEYYQQFVLGGLWSTAELYDQGRTLEELERQWGVPVREVSPQTATAALPLAHPHLQTAWYEHDGREHYLVRSSKGTWLRVGPFAAYPSTPWGGRIALAIGLAFALGVAAWLALRPLDRAQRAIASTALAIRDGDLAARVSVSDMRAAPAIGDALNRMAQRVEKLVQARDHLLRTASHELRTPIARLRIGVHLLAQTDGDRDAREAALDADLAELDSLVEDLLTHARLREPDRPPTRQRVELAPVLDALVRTLETPATLRRDLQAATLDADPKLFVRVLRNLLANAVRFAEQRVTVRTYESPHGTVLEVHDDGPGIPEARREDALAPFGTVGPSQGHGLGLAIVADILTHHGGTFELAASPEGGLLARTVWPPTAPG